jgi:class 3 adenylate cyclase/tetratricopeptide (TPR) repeat protein
MNCPRCARDTPTDARFCPECGARLTAACAACGAPNPASHTFCAACGERLGEKAGAPAGRFASPFAYTPAHLAGRILTSKAVLEGERKHVTVLFADLKGSMELLAHRDPEEARAVLDPVLEHMMEAVHRYEGTVNQVLGDGIMALFGAPVAHEDHAVRACYAAMQIQEAVARHAARVGSTEGVPVQVRVGLNSGEVVVRSIGSDLHMDYTAVGHTTHLAARLEQFASPGTICLSDHTRRLAEGFVQVRALGPVPMKGLAEPVAVFELTDTITGRTRFQVAAARGLTRFVGRATETATLQRGSERVARGEGQVVAVIAEPGVGKSRLFWEFTHAELLRGWFVLESAATAYGRTTPYRPVIDLFRTYFQVQDHDPAPRARERIAGRVASVDPALAADTVVFTSLLDVAAPDPRWEALDPLERRRLTLDACLRLLLRESEAQPLVLVLEDLHWIDAETQLLLDRLVGAIAGARILLLVNYRPEFRHTWAGRAPYTELSLDALPPDRAGELLDLRVGSTPELSALKQVLIERSEGNPFFLEEGVRTLVETGALVGERGARRLVASPERLAIPATIQALLAARIDRLPPDDKQLLQTAAVIGKDVPLRLLGAVAPAPADVLARRLADLHAAEFLDETRRFPDEPEYGFRHALTHEVAYAGLLESQRRSLHAQIVEATERIYADRLAEQVDRLAYHAMRGEAWDKAAHYLQQSAQKAAGRSAHRSAVRAMEDALLALAHLAPTAETTRRSIDARFALRNWLFALGEHARVPAHLEEARRLAEASADTDRLAWTQVYMSNYFWREGDPERAVELGQQALTVGEERGDLPLTATANFRLGQAFHGRGDYRSATRHLRRNVAALTGEDRLALFGFAGLPSVFSLGFLVWSLAELGEFEEGRAYAEEAIAIADVSGQMYSRAFARFALGFLHLQRGDFAEALLVLERGRAIQESGEILALRTMFLGLLGHAHSLAGRHADALALLEQAVDPSTFALSPQHPFPLLFFGQAQLAAGQVEAAAGTARCSLALCRSRRDRGGEAWSLLLTAEAALRQTPPEAGAPDSGVEALALAEQLCMRPLAAHCHRGLGRAHERAGIRARAREHRDRASTMYRDMGMTFWVGMP